MHTHHASYAGFLPSQHSTEPQTRRQPSGSRPSALFSFGGSRGARSGGSDEHKKTLETEVIIRWATVSRDSTWYVLVRCLSDAALHPKGIVEASLIPAPNMADPWIVR